MPATLEEKVDELAEAIVKLRVNEAVLMQKMDRNSNCLDELHQDVHKMMSMLERGKGAAWLARALWAAVIASGGIIIASLMRWVSMIENIQKQLPPP